MTKFHIFATMTTLLTLTSCETLNITELSSLIIDPPASLSTEKIIDGLKEALATGTDSAVKQLSQKEGFSKNDLFRVKIPKKLTKVTDTMKKIGLGFLVDNFENKMNEAAERATASAGPVFFEAIKQMKFTDAKNILYGEKTAATDYLKKTTSGKLIQLYKPIIEKSMKEVGVVKIYNDLMSKYDAIPFKSKPKFSLENYVTDKALNAMFSSLAVEEKKIREDPLARTSELLKEVFAFSSTSLD